MVNQKAGHLLNGQLFDGTVDDLANLVLKSVQLHREDVLQRECLDVHVERLTCLLDQLFPVTEHGTHAGVQLLSCVVEPYSVAIEMSDGRGLVPRNMNTKHGPVIIGTSEISVNSQRHKIFLLSMQCIYPSADKLLPCTIHHAIEPFGRKVVHLGQRRIGEKRD